MSLVLLLLYIMYSNDIVFVNILLRKKLCHAFKFMLNISKRGN